MRRLHLLACCVFIAPAAFGQYSYWYTESFLGSLSAYWTHNGTITGYPEGLTTGSGEGSLISTLSIPYTAPVTSGMYEVQTTLNLLGTGGTFVTYLDATSNALSASGSSTGTFYSVELTPTLSGGLCSATLVINKAVSGSLTSLASGTASCGATTVIRVVRAWNWIHVYVNSVDSLWAYDSAIATGQAGIGASGNGYAAHNHIVGAGLGVLEIVSPTAVSASTIGTSSFANRVDIQWQGTTDNSGGSGLSDYSLYRGSTWLGLISAATVGSFSDTTVAAGTSYTYTLYAVDYHLNAASTTFTITTPPSGSVDPRQVGVRPTGTSWGTNPEQLNLLSGNLNYSLPLVKAQGRSAGVGFSLSYNSQNWRQDGAGVWNLGRDVGFGYGWKLLAGSITPFWSDYWTIDHYTFTDASGAEYRLSVNNGSNVWSSAESIYLQFDANAGVLHFPDGTFWVMGCESAGSEQDQGTYYPTVMEDTNGNQILLTYGQGRGTWWNNSSARILTIEDVRATYSSGAYSTYQFAYNSDPIPHLTGITNSIGTGETYDFSYSSFTLTDPFTNSSFGTVSKLAGVTLPNDSSAAYVFTSDSSGGLTEAQLPFGGYIRWTYSSFTYTGSRVQREIAARYLSSDGTSGSEQEYSISHETDDGLHTIHAQTTLNDPGGVGQQYWEFSQSGVTLGLATTYKGNDLVAGTTKLENDYSWTQDSAGNNYIGVLYKTLDPGQTYAATSSSAQSMDIYGNVTAVSYNNYSSLGGGYHWTGYSYLNTSPYTSRYIFNRLSSSSTTTDFVSFTTLATISYDGATLTGSSTPREWDTGYTGVTARGNATSMTDVSGITSTTTYDLYGNVAGATNGSGVTSSATTTSTTNYAAPDSITVGGSLTTSMTYDSFLGLTNQTGPNGTSVNIGYDTNARNTSSQSPFGAYTYTSYTDTGSTPNVCVSTNKRWTQNFMDGLGRTIKTLTGTYAGVATGPATCSADSGATVLSQSEVSYGPSGSSYPSAGTSPTGRLATSSVPHTGSTASATTTYTYDGIGRTVSTAVVGSDTAGTTQYSYAGNTVTVLDPALREKVYTTDGFGNLVKVVEDPSGLNYSTTYSYDILNHLTGVSMPRTGFTTQTRSWSYSGNMLMSATNPENGTISYTYGSNNKVATRTDAKGQVTAYTYDSLIRLSEVQRYPTGIAGGEDTCQRETYYYDGVQPSPPGGYPVSPSFPANALGRLSGIMYQGGHAAGASPACDTTFIELYTYNTGGAATGKLMQVDRIFPISFVGNETYGINFTAGFSYDNEGRLTGVQYPSMKDEWSVTSTAPSLSYTYDSMGRLNGATDTTASQTLVAGTSYGPSNELLSVTGASGGWYGETRTYNSIKQLTSLSSSGLSIAYNYPSSNNNGKINSQSDSVSGETVTYTYDSLNRLITAQNQTGFTPLWGQSYAYDGFGNLTGTSVTQGSAPTLSVTYDVNNHAGGEDANGNPPNVYLPADGSSYATTYDVENRITSTGAGAIFYGYAPGNRRVWRGTGTWTTHSGPGTGQCNTDQWSTDEITFWGVNGQKLMTYNLVENYYGGGGGGECDFTATAAATDYYFGAKLIKNLSGYVYPDRLGSIGKYYPYGVERPSATSIGTEKFTGYFRDSDTGNDYAINRYMTPGTGRFITPDPSKGVFANPATPGSWNLYAYTKGDPANLIDPEGLDDNDDNCGPDDYSTVCNIDNTNYVPDPGGAGGSVGGGAPGDPTPSTPSPTCPYLVCVVVTTTQVQIPTPNAASSANLDSEPDSEPGPAPVPEPPGGPPIIVHGAPPLLPPGHIWRPTTKRSTKPNTGPGRPIRYNPVPPVKSPDGGQPSISFDPEGHWDYNDGLGGPRVHISPGGVVIQKLTVLGILASVVDDLWPILLLAP